MRLLLDEHYAAQIAVQLRARGRDVVTVVESGLAGTDDEALLATAHTQRRALLTNNVRDLVPIHARWMAAGRSHHGLWLTDDRRLPRTTATIGRYVVLLDERMVAAPAEEAFRDRVVWLP